MLTQKCDTTRLVRSAASCDCARRGVTTGETSKDIFVLPLKKIIVPMKQGELLCRTLYNHQ